MFNCLKKDNTEIVHWLCAFLIFFETLPKWMWGMHQLFPDVMPIVILFLAYKDLVQSKSSLWAILALIFQLVVLFVFYYERMGGVKGTIINVITWFGFFPVFLCSAQFLKKCANCFIRILAVLLIIALLEHLLVYLYGKSIVAPVSMECPYNPDREYYSYFFNVYLTRYAVMNIMPRFYAFYDEPGVLGNIMMVLLYCGRFNFRKWYNIVFLISGLLSFSLAFYIAMVVWYLVFGSIKVKIVFAVVTTITIYFFYDNVYLYDMIFSRMEFTNEGLSGYNREKDELQIWYNSHPISSLLFWGYGASGTVPYAASWKWAFAQYGVFPSMIYLCSLIKSRISRYMKKSDMLLGIFIVFVFFIQRPFFYRWSYAFFMVLPLIYYYSIIESKITVVSQQ